MNRPRLLIVAFAVAALIPAAASAKGFQRFFFAPGIDLSCEIDVSMKGIPTQAYCQTEKHPQSVILATSGNTRVCTGATCVGDPPEGTPTLVYGASLTAGPFKCTSLKTGMQCVVAKTGHGFLITAKKITSISV